MAGMIFLTALLFILGIVYPIGAIIVYKMCGSKKTIRQILSEI